jgi:hypothetical protein
LEITARLNADTISFERILTISYTNSEELKGGFTKQCRRQIEDATQSREKTYLSNTTITNNHEFDILKHKGAVLKNFCTAIEI